jgi:hypothetical protein
MAVHELAHDLLTFSSVLLHSRITQHLPFLDVPKVINVGRLGQGFSERSNYGSFRRSRSVLMEHWLSYMVDRILSVMEGGVGAWSGLVPHILPRFINLIVGMHFNLVVGLDEFP